MLEASIKVCQKPVWNASLKTSPFPYNMCGFTLSIVGSEKLSFIILLCLFISLCNAFYDWNANHIILCNIIAVVNNDITCYLGNIKMLLIVTLPR